MDLKEEAILGEDIYQHWYYVSKGRALRAFLRGVQPHTILDVGAGSGIFSKILLESTGATMSTCVDTGYTSERKEMWNEKPIQFRRSIEDSQADLALFIDVLEHIDDDVALLESYVRKLPPGCYVLMSVPAFQFLFSGHDAFLEHKRRYTRKQLETVVHQAGLDLIRSRYFFGLLFPFVAAQRLVNKLVLKSTDVGPNSTLRKHSGLMNHVLTQIHRCELGLLPYNNIAGLSLFCLCKIPD